MVRARVLATVALFAVVSVLQCNSSSDKTPSSIAEVYHSGTVAALRADGEVRIDRVGPASDSSATLFEVGGYRLVESGRLLTSDENATLRRTLLEPRTYTKVGYLCIFEPEFAFSLTHGADMVYVVVGTECHQAAVHRADSTEFSNLTEQASKELQGFCDALLSAPTE